jgi:hypothetical protein
MRPIRKAGHRMLTCFIYFEGNLEGGSHQLLSRDFIPDRRLGHLLAEGMAPAGCARGRGVAGTVRIICSRSQGPRSGAIGLVDRRSPVRTAKRTRTPAGPVGHSCRRAGERNPVPGGDPRGIYPGRRKSARGAPYSLADSVRLRDAGGRLSCRSASSRNNGNTHLAAVRT